jgi:hypothetical protein
MTQGSEAAAAATAAQVTLRQRTREGETRFDLYTDRLDYAFSSRLGTRVERRIPWNVVPQISRLRRTARPDRRVNTVVRLSVIVLIFFFAAHLNVAVSPLLLVLAIAAVTWGVTMLLLRRFRIHHSILRTSQGNIVVLGDAAHDAILAQLATGRRAYFRPFAAIDDGKSTRWNLQRLRWLLESDAIGLQEFVRAQHALLPNVPQPLIRPLPDAGPDLHVEQHFCNALFAFDFHADRLAYRYRTGAGVENAFTVNYLDLQEPTTDVQVGAPSPLLPYATLWLLVIGFGYVLEMFGHFPGGYFAGTNGLERGLVVFAPGIAAVALAIFVARRLMRQVCTKLPQDIFILRNRQHDAILAELKRRRSAAFKVLAEPDPLLSPAAQANVYGALKEQGILDASEIPALLARGAALQEHLGLAETGPEDAADAPGDAPTPPPAPRPTIH